MELLLPAGLVLAVVSPILSAAYIAGVVRAELRGLRRDVDRHERELAKIRRAGYADT